MNNEELINATVIKARLVDLVQSCAAIGFVGSILGIGLGAYESVAQQSPLIKTCLHSGLNVGVFSSLTLLVRDSLKRLRVKHLQIKDDKVPMGTEGAIAGGLTGFVAGRMLGRQGSSAVVGAIWCSLIAGVFDAILTKAWKDIEMQRHKKDHQQ